MSQRSEYEKIPSFDWADLDGKTLKIVVVAGQPHVETYGSVRDVRVGYIVGFEDATGKFYFLAEIRGDQERKP